MVETVFMDQGEKSSDGVVKLLEEDKVFAAEGYKVERVQLRAVQCPCGKWYHAVLDLGYRCPVCGTGEDKAVDRVRVADFAQANGKWAIEKKLAGNLYSSLVNKELYPQMEKIGAVYGTGGCVAFQGYMSLLIEQHPAQAAWISSIQASAPLLYGVPFTVVEDDLGMARLIHAYVQQSRHDSAIARFKVNELKKESAKLAAICSVKGIGEGLGIKGLQYYGSLQKMANSSVFELEPIFHSKAQAVHELFHGDAKQEVLDLAGERRKRKEEKEKRARW